ncbi:MAG: c-type cytochrome [Magnetovibrionaceae bacterium]
MKTTEKIGLASLLTAWVVFGAHWAGELLVSPDTEVAEELRISLPEDDGAVAEAAPEPEPLEAPVDLVALLAAASLESGEKGFKKCGSCHTVDDGGPNRVGPNLWGIVGRDKASAAGFNYSEALSGLGGAWTPENLYKFLYKPKEYAPGNKMSFKGLTKQQDRIDLIAYLNGQSSAPVSFGQ